MLEMECTGMERFEMHVGKSTVAGAGGFPMSMMCPSGSMQVLLFRMLRVACLQVGCSLSHIKVQVPLDAGSARAVQLQLTFHAVIMSGQHWHFGTSSGGQCFRRNTSIRPRVSLHRLTAQVVEL